MGSETETEARLLLLTGVGWGLRLRLRLSAAKATGGLYTSSLRCHLLGRGYHYNHVGDYCDTVGINLMVARRTRGVVFNSRTRFSKERPGACL